MWLIFTAMLFAQAGDCGSGYEYHQGVCAEDIKPNKPKQENEVQPSDEKPRRGQQLEWQTGDVKADMPPTRASEDAKMDAEKFEADAEGKKAAGLDEFNGKKP